MNEDDLHELRMTIGQQGMDIADAMDDDVIRAIGEAKEAMNILIGLLEEKGIGKQLVAGMIGAAIVQVLDR